MHRPDEAAIAEALAELHAEYAVGVEARVERLRAVVVEARAALGDASVVDAALREAHRLHGSAGSHGFPDASAAARRLEQALEAVLAGAHATDDSYAELDAGLTQLERVLDRLRGSSD